MWTDHLGVVVDEKLGDTTLSVHQEAISSSFLSERGLVTRGNQCVQLALAATHQLHKLMRKKSREFLVPTLTSSHTHAQHHVVLMDGVTFNAHCKERERTERPGGMCDIISCLLHNDNNNQIIKRTPLCPSDPFFQSPLTFDFFIFTLKVTKSFHPLIFIFLPVLRCLFSEKSAETDLLFNLIHTGLFLTQTLT